MCSKIVWQPGIGKRSVNATKKLSHLMLSNNKKFHLFFASCYTVIKNNYLPFDGMVYGLMRTIASHNGQIFGSL